MMAFCRSQNSACILYQYGNKFAHNISEFNVGALVEQFKHFARSSILRGFQKLVPQLTLSIEKKAKNV
jgi:hypothetical protein